MWTYSGRRLLPQGARGLVPWAVSLLVTALLAVAQNLGIVSTTVSLLLSAVVVLVATVLHLGVGRHLLASAVGMVLSAAPALVLATGVMTLVTRLGVPFDVLSTRLAAVTGWWLAVIALGPVVRRLGTPRMPAWLAALLSSPLLVVVALCGLAWNTGQSGTRAAQRFVFLFRFEDNAAWVSHAAALLRNGHIPQNVSESEYFGYSPVSSIPGVLTETALQGRPTGRAVFYTTIDVTMANQLLAVVVAAGLVMLAFLIALVNVDSDRRPPLVGTLLLSVVLAGVGASVLAASPLITAGHMSLAWANDGIVLTGLLAFLALRAESRAEFVPLLVAAGLAAYVTGGSWAFVVLTPVTFGVLMLSLRKTGLRSAPARPLGGVARVASLSAVIITAAVVAAAPQFISSLSAVGLQKLSGAEGGIAPVEPLTLALVALVALATAAIGYRREETFSIVSALMIAASCTAAGLVYLSQVVPGTNPTYSLTKSLYVVLAVSMLGVAGLLARASTTRFSRVVVVGVLVASVLITTSPTFGGVLKLWGTAHELDPAMGQRFLALASRSAGSEHVVCQPSPYIAALDNYMCNRWADSLSRKQLGSDFRLSVLGEGGSAPAAWAKAKSDGYLRHATVVNAAEVETGRCVPSEVTAASVRGGGPVLRVRAKPVRNVDLGSAVGGINSVQECTHSVVVIGWAPFSRPDEVLNAWAGRAVRPRTIVRNDRPEVRQAAGNGSLVNPGFVLVFRKTPGLASRLCLQWAGPHHPLIKGSHPRGCSGHS